MSSAYITQQYIQLFLSKPQVDALLAYGENDTVSASMKLDLLISASSDKVDSFLNVAGYSTPLAIIPESIKQATCYLVISDLLTTANQTIPDQLSKQINDQYAYLNELKNKKLLLEGLTQSEVGGTGGSAFYYGTGTANQPSRIFSVNAAKGYFF